MIERHTFKELIKSVMITEEGIKKLEAALNIHMDQNWLLDAEAKVIHAIAEGFQHEKINDFQVDIVEELLYHFIFMEDCGNESEHCKSKLVIINKGKEDQHSMPCTNLDELYNVITLFVDRTDINFDFNYCHSNHLDEELK